MIAFLDTSFLVALYRMQSNTPFAIRYYQGMTVPLIVSTLLLFEFRQSMRLQSWLFKLDRTKGFSEREGEQAIADLSRNLTDGAIQVASIDWPDVYRIAEDLSRKHTRLHGHRTLDVLHVATAIHLEAEEFLTFDAAQRRLANAEGLKPRPLKS